jgi:hypothetical protein
MAIQQRLAEIQLAMWEKFMSTYMLSMCTAEAEADWWMSEVVTRQGVLCHADGGVKDESTFLRGLDIKTT